MSGSPLSLPETMLAATRADWEVAVVKALKGGDAARLKTITRDGLVLEPLASVEAIRPLPGWRAAGPWAVITRIDHPDTDEAHAQIMADLTGGADGLTLVFQSSPGARGFGLPLDVNFARLLDGVIPEIITIRIEAGLDTAAIAARLKAFAGPASRIVAAHDAVALALVEGGHDGALVATGHCDGRVIHDAGGTDGQELAYVLAAAVAALRAGMAASDIHFTLTADIEQFATIAKFRALRLLWALVQEECGLAPLPARIHGETAWRMMTRLDAPTNILRTAIAAFSGGLGGADSLTVLPFTSALGLPEAQARRYARNSQRVILDEANAWRVADAGAGAGAIEAETAALAAKAWDLLQGIEAAGGLLQAVAAGTLQADVARVAAERARDVARRKVPLTGVSEFPDLTELPATVLAPARAASAPRRAHAVTPLAPHRLAEPFERLRDRAAATRPRAFMAVLGAIADFTARAAWTRNLMEAGGIAAPVGDGFADLAALTEAFRAAATPLAVIASSDAIYEDQALAAIASLKAAGAGIVVVAGKPKDPAFEAALRAAGATTFLAAGMDVLAALDDLLTQLNAGA